MTSTIRRAILDGRAEFERRGDLDERAGESDPNRISFRLVSPPPCRRIIRDRNNELVRSHRSLPERVRREGQDDGKARVPENEYDHAHEFDDAHEHAHEHDDEYERRRRSGARSGGGARRRSRLDDDDEYDPTGDTGRMGGVRAERRPGRTGGGNAPKGGSFRLGTRWRSIGYHSVRIAGTPVES